jgi:hypothetical protein
MAAGYPGIRAKARWLYLDPGRMRVNSEVITSDADTDGAAPDTAEFLGDSATSRIVLTVQPAALADDLDRGIGRGTGRGIANLGGVAERCMRWNA